jgi:kynurenine formamidase
MDTQDPVGDLGNRLSNWGRWGPDDEIGTLNYVTETIVLNAAKLVKTGEIVQLGLPLDHDGPQRDRPRRFNPIHLMTVLPTDAVRPDGSGIADDVLIMPLQSVTQWDSLAHVAYRGRIYGGKDAHLVTTSGAAVNSIRAISGRVVSRGVLIDVARFHGVAALKPGHAITAAEITDTLRMQGGSVGEGDILLIRTGFLEECRQRGWEGFFGESPGLALDTLEWIHDMRIAGIATDTVAAEVRPSEIEGFRSPFHVVALVYMGLLLGELFDCETLGARCANDSRYDFLLVASPLPVTGGVGTPINPYAIR